MLPSEEGGGSSQFEFSPDFPFSLKEKLGLVRFVYLSIMKCCSSGFRCVYSSFKEKKRKFPRPFCAKECTNLEFAATDNFSKLRVTN